MATNFTVTMATTMSVHGAPCTFCVEKCRAPAAPVAQIVFVFVFDDDDEDECSWSPLLPLSDKL